MNTIEQLLHTHCPNGVEFKALGEDEAIHRIRHCETCTASRGNP